MFSSINTTHLPRTQASVANSPSACTFVSAMYADAILTGDVTLSPKLLDNALSVGCAAWNMLMLESRKRDLKLSDEYMSAKTVVDAVMTENGTPRWKILHEYFGLHTTGAVPQEILDSFKAVSHATSDGSSPPTTGVDSLLTALRNLDATMNNSERPDVAALLTFFGSHTVCIGARLRSTDAVYYIIDSLEGTMYELNAPTPFCNFIAEHICPAYAWTDETTRMMKEPDALKRAHMPGQFFMTVISKNY